MTLTDSTTRFDEVLVIEDNAATAERRREVGVSNDDVGQTITVRVHRVNAWGKAVAASKVYPAGSARSKRSGRIQLADGLLGRAVAPIDWAVVVAGTYYGSSPAFLAALRKRGLPFIVQIRPSTMVRLVADDSVTIHASEALDQAEWSALTITHPDGTQFSCSASKLATVSLPVGQATLFAAQVGSIRGVHRGTIIGLSSFDADLADLVRLVSYARWIRTTTRQGARRENGSANGVEPTGVSSKLAVRVNINLARRQDARRQASPTATQGALKGMLRKAASTLNVVELFSGAGGMGLGFLLGGGAEARYRIVYSAEANPIFARTLRQNHELFECLKERPVEARTPPEITPVDLRQQEALRAAVESIRASGEAHVLIGGPPCQGFSMANRNSWSGHNPHNELIKVFLDYVQAIRPLVFLVENVQGILWTPDGKQSSSIVDIMEQRMASSGYTIFPKIIDAAWYGVPQHRTRLFILGLHRDLGYSTKDFDRWGPFPVPAFGSEDQPYITVREAIGDLPQIGNGASSGTLKYPSLTSEMLHENPYLKYLRQDEVDEVITDHVTSRHADYVIERYAKIPEGGNWESIRSDLSNYANVDRTHSNIYRRLRWDEPSVTIGHYRKSMLVHPSQDRGLSLREATRLQSFPDWFRFAGTTDGGSGGLMHKQQQLANAVCPLVTKALAEFILEL